MSLEKFENNFLNKKFKPHCAFETGIKELPVLSHGSMIEIRTNRYNLLYKIIQTQLYIGNYCLWIDADHSTDFSIFGKSSNLFIAQPNSPEEGLDILTEPLLKCLNIVVIDSILNVLPLEGDYTTLEAKLSNIRKILPKTCSIIFINPFLTHKYNIFAKYMDIILNINKYTGKVIKDNKTLKLFIFNH